MELDRLIVMGNVSDLADNSEEVTNFLTITKVWTDLCLYFPYFIPNKEGGTGK